MFFDCLLRKPIKMTFFWIKIIIRHSNPNVSKNLSIQSNLINNVNLSKKPGFFIHYKKNSFSAFFNNKLFFFQSVLLVKDCGKLSRRNYFFVYFTHILSRFGLVAPLSKKFWGK
jgi:hypothetical protein